jgi:hypothetical protein
VHVLGTILSSAADVFNRPIRALSAMNLLLPYTEMPGIGELQESLARLVKGTAKKSSKAGSSAEPRSPEDQAARKAAADEAMAVLKEMTLPHRAKRKPATKAAEGKAPAVPAPDVDLLDPQTIVVDPSVQPREKLDEAVVDEYAEAMLSGATFPLVTVFRDPADGGLILADGFHRHAAAIRAGQARIRARIYVGTRREAVMHAAGANAKHGLRRTNADKRRAVMMLLNDDEWAQFPDREIGRRCGVTHPFVANVREDLARGNDYHADAAGGDHGTPGTSTAAGGTDGALGADETVGAEDAAAADDAEASPAQASVDQGGIEPTEGTSTVPAGPANAAPSPEADATTASTGLDAMIPTDMADDRGPGVGTDAPSASELIGLVIGRLQQDHEAYPIDIVAAIRDELGKGYPGFLATVQALFDAALVQLQAQIDAAARAEAQAQAASQVPAQPPAPVVAQVTLDL